MYRRDTVSIIIPVYNQCETLNKVLESIEKNSYSDKNVEVIIVDDCSSDGISQILNSHKKMNLVYVRNKKNRGRAFSRNIGASYATGSYLIFTDGDRVVSNTFIKHHIKNLIDNANAVCIGSVIDMFIKDVQTTEVEKIMSEDDQIRRFMFYYYYQDAVLELYNSDCEVKWCTLMSGNFSIKRETFESVRGFDEKFTQWGLENIEFGYRLQKNGIKFVFEREAKNYHFFHAQERSAIRLNQSIRYFFNKYKDCKILDYYLFLLGVINLKEFTGYSQHSAKYLNNASLGRRL